MLKLLHRYHTRPMMLSLYRVGRVYPMFRKLEVQLQRPMPGGSRSSEGSVHHIHPVPGVLYASSAGEVTGDRSGLGDGRESYGVPGASAVGTGMWGQ